MLLKDGISIVVDRDSHLTVQPNLRAVKCQYVLNFFEDCPFNAPVIVRIMVPVGD